MSESEWADLTTVIVDYGIFEIDESYGRALLLLQLPFFINIWYMPFLMIKRIRKTNARAAIIFYLLTIDLTRAVINWKLNDIKNDEPITGHGKLERFSMHSDHGCLKWHR